MGASPLGFGTKLEDLLPALLSGEGPIVDEDGLQVCGVEQAVRADHGHLCLCRCLGQGQGGGAWGSCQEGEGHFEPGGPAGQVPLCVRCQGQGSKGEECFLVSERMDMEEGVDRDSGMETEGELELFPEN